MVEVVVRRFGSLRCDVFAGCSSVVLRVSKHVRSCVSMPFCFLFASLVIIAFVWCMLSRAHGVFLLLTERMFSHLCIPISHIGARCFRSVFEYVGVCNVVGFDCHTLWYPNGIGLCVYCHGGYCQQLAMQLGCCPRFQYLGIVVGDSGVRSLLWS